MASRAFLIVAGPILAGAALLLIPPAGRAQSEQKVDYETEIQPILEDYCYQCHGSDSKAREADFRLDRKADAFSDLGGYMSIVPGDPDDSEIYLRIDSEFEEDRMPPYDAGTVLSDDQIQLIRLWIAQGAEWTDEQNAD